VIANIKFKLKTIFYKIAIYTCIVFSLFSMGSTGLIAAVENTKKPFPSWFVNICNYIIPKPNGWYFYLWKGIWFVIFIILTTFFYLLSLFIITKKNQHVNSRK
jgi:hypothetical protein